VIRPQGIGGDQHDVRCHLRRGAARQNDRRRQPDDERAAHLSEHSLWIGHLFRRVVARKGTCAVARHEILPTKHVESQPIVDVHASVGSSLVDNPLEGASHSDDPGRACHGIKEIPSSRRIILGYHARQGQDRGGQIGGPDRPHTDAWRDAW